MIFYVSQKEWAQLVYNWSFKTLDTYKYKYIIHRVFISYMPFSIH